MPWASRPPMNPASTSPDPAVASQGAPDVFTTARPSGAATTVSGPFSSTTAPERLAAARAAAMRSGEPASRPGNTLSNSPGCGVITSRGPSAANRASGSPWNTVRASASTTRAASVPARARRLARVAGVTPAAGPITAALALAAASARRSGEAKAVSITASRCAALTITASGGESKVTRPAPIRSPPRAANRAAPVWVMPPETTTRPPRVCLWASTSGQGKASAQSSGPFSNRFVPEGGGRPISATTTSPQKLRAGSSTWAGFLRWKVTVRAACGA